MADLDDFFAKKDKKKKGTKKFSQANTDVIAKNLEESAIKEQLQQDKDITNIGDEMNPENVNQQVRGDGGLSVFNNNNTNTQLLL